MRIEQRPHPEPECGGLPGWWITDLPGGEEDLGAYGTKASAEKGMRQLEKFFKHENDPKYILGEHDAREYKQSLAAQTNQ